VALLALSQGTVALGGPESESLNGVSEAPLLAPILAAVLRIPLIQIFDCPRTEGVRSGVCVRDVSIVCDLLREWIHRIPDEAAPKQKHHHKKDTKSAFTLHPKIPCGAYAALHELAKCLLTNVTAFLWVYAPEPRQQATLEIACSRIERFVPEPRERLIEPTTVRAGDLMQISGSLATRLDSSPRSRSRSCIAHGG
jgi:hypothetical protein